MLILHECDLTDASFWEEFYIDLFRSYGFDLVQSRKSHYSENYKHKLSQIKKERELLDIYKDVPDELNTLAHKLKLHRDVVIRMALREYVSKYKNIIEENDLNVFKDCYLENLSRTIKNSHDYFYSELPRKPFSTYK